MAVLPSKTYKLRKHVKVATKKVQTFISCRVSLSKAPTMLSMGSLEIREYRI